MFHRIIFLLLIFGSLSCNFNRCTVCFQSFSEHRLQSTQNAARIKRFKDYTSIKALNKKNIIVSLLCWSLTLLCSFKHSLQLALQKWEPAGRICDFGNFFNSLAKSPRVLRSSWILNERNLCCKIVKYCILSEACMIKRIPHSTLSPQMWCINGIKGWFTRTQICWQDFVK